MPTTFTPDPTSGLTPSAVPGPDTIPLLTQPLDGETANVASIAQEVRALANEIAWLKSPRAAVSALAQGVVSFMNARLQKRFGIDHLGFPAGQIQSWMEDWLSPSFTVVTSASGANQVFGSRWMYTNTVGTSGIIVPAGPTGPFNAPSIVIASITGTAVNTGIFTPLATFFTSDDVSAALSFVCSPTGATGDIAVTDLACGFCTDPTSSGVQLSANGLQGAWFSKRNGDTNWQCAVRSSSSGSVAYTDSGVAASATLRRMRIEFTGPNSSDDGVSRFNFFIDGGSPVASVATVLTGSPLGLRVLFSNCRTAAGAAGPGRIQIGPVFFRSNLLAGNTFP